jgi:hypothetical protein
MNNYKHLFILLVSFTIVSCGINSERAIRYTTIKGHLKKQQPETALKYLNTKFEDYSEREKMLWYLDKGILNFYNKDFNQAIKYLKQADQLQEQLYTESVTANIGSFLVNDNVTKYRGEDFELIYINVFKALSYLELKDYDGAMVEVRKGQEKHKILESRYAEEIEDMKKAAEDDGKNANLNSVQMGEYSSVDSGVLRLLGVILYRLDNEADDSRIDKEKLAELWENYPNLYDFETPDLTKIDTELDSKFAYVDIFALEGQTPQKLAWDLDVMCTNGALFIQSSIPGRALDMDAIPVYANTNFNFSLSVPFLSKNSSRTGKIELYVNDELIQDLKIVEKVSNFAMNDYQKKKTYMIIKSAMRAFGKAYAAKLASDEVQRQSKDAAIGLLTSLLTQAVVSASEVADTRSWNLLNDAFYFKEIKLPKGQHKVEIKYIDNNGLMYHTHTQVLNIENTRKPEIIISYAF